MPTDNKFGWSLIYKVQTVTTNMVDNNDVLQALKTSYQTKNPNVSAPGFPLTAQQISDINTMITAYNTFISDYSATISMLQAKDVGSHKGDALD